MDVSKDKDVPSTDISNSRKKERVVWLTEFSKKIRLQSFETGQDCDFPKQCFQKVGDHKQDIIKTITNLRSNNVITLIWQP